jgi:alpha-mannosidase
LGRSSRISQRYVLDAGSPVLRIETHLDWQEEDMILRAEFLPAIRSRFATHGIQFGCIERPTHENTSWEQAAFEVPGHLWMDLSQPGRGLAVLDDGSRLGRSCRGSRMGLSLVRATRFPDPQADRGIHHFTYGLMPHRGNWRQEGVSEEAERLLRAPRTMTAHAATSGARHDQWSCLPELGGMDGVEISACKKAEDGVGWIVRLVETQGGCGTIRFLIPDQVTQVQEVDLLEAETPHSELKMSGGHCELGMDPFQIRTVRLS